MRRWIMGGLAFLVACSSMAGIRIGEKEIDGSSLTDYATYAWVSNHPSESGSFLADGSSSARWMESVGDKVLASRGFKPVSREEASLHLRYTALSTGALQVAKGSTEHPDVNWVIDPQAHSTLEFREGALVIEALDAETGDLVWAGWAADTVSVDERKLTKTLEKAINKILKQVPKR